MRSRIQAFAVCLLVLGYGGVFAYEIDTHKAMASYAVSRSTLNAPATLRKLGLLPLYPTSSTQSFPTILGPGPTGGSYGTPISIVELVRFGAAWEDNLAAHQALRHFYDPVRDLPLDLPYVRTSLSTKSPDWALEDSSEYSNPGSTQPFSYKDARSSFYEALVDPDPIRRARYWGHLFQSLGHVVHHLQDMAQPQHVRNDAHCDASVCGYLAALSGSTVFHSPSAYERFTDNRVTSLSADQIDFGGVGSDAVFPPILTGNSSFQIPRHFWRTTAVGSDIYHGKGIAEYTNRGFFSAGSMNSYPSPIVGPFPSETLDITAARPGTPLRGLIAFYSNVVHDELLGTDPENKRAVSESIFDADLQQYNPAHALLYSLNEYTFRAANDFLVPRAVGYSAGLINYFFRGDLEMALPAAGAFSVADMSVAACPPPCGFRRVTLRVRNITPDEDITAGTLRVVAKYYRNTCHQLDLSGEFGAPAFLGNPCRSVQEFVTASLPKSVGSVDRSFQELQFDFPTGTPIPLNASDISLQIVFRGRLGLEDDAVAVSTRKVLEPNYFAVGNITDYAFDLDNDRYVTGQSGVVPVQMQDVGLSFFDPDQNPGIPVTATLPTLGPAQHAQLAVLTEPGARYWLRSNSKWLPRDNFAFPVQEFVLDESVSPPQYVRSCPVTLERGAYRQYFVYFADILHGIVGKIASPDEAQDGSLADAGSGAPTRKVLAVNCYASPPPGSGGRTDLSGMTPPFHSGNAISWVVSF